MRTRVTCWLVCAVLLLVSLPSQAMAQTTAQPAGAARAKPDLKTSVAEVVTKSRLHTVTRADIKRFEKEGPQNTPKNFSGLSKKEKILVYSVVAGLIVLAVVLAVKTGKGGHTFCDMDPTDPECIGPFP